MNNLTKRKISDAGLKRVALYVLGKEDAEEKDLSIALVGPRRSQELNKKYRGKDTPANVLSFPAEEFGLGEIVICPQVVSKDAKNYGILFQEAVYWMLIHGILHLLGYTHKEMEKKESAYRKDIQ